MKYVPKLVLLKIITWLFTSKPGIFVSTFAFNPSVAVCLASAIVLTWIWETGQGTYDEVKNIVCIFSLNNKYYT